MKRTVLTILFLISLVAFFVLLINDFGGINNNNNNNLNSSNLVLERDNSFRDRVVSYSDENINSSTNSISNDLVNVKVFFGNNQEDPGAIDCQASYVVDRQIYNDDNKYLAVMEELLKGPSSDEITAGFFTSINAGVKVPDIIFMEGIITVDFGSDLEKNVGGSCRVGAIRSQINNTLSQFSEVKEVIISVDGRIDDALQP